MVKILWMKEKFKNGSVNKFEQTHFDATRSGQVSTIWCYWTYWENLQSVQEYCKTRIKAII